MRQAQSSLNPQLDLWAPLLFQQNYTMNNLRQIIQRLKRIHHCLSFILSLIRSLFIHQSSHAAIRITDEIIPEKRLFYNDGMHHSGFEQA